MTEPVAPQLFDLLIRYAKEMEEGKIKTTPSLGSTSPALTFCENFYAQFFQNRLNKEIKQFSHQAKRAAVALRLDLKAEQSPSFIILLITWYEKLCDIYPSVLALGYGVGGKAVFLDFHSNYLQTLLERASTWAEQEKYPSIEQKAQEALKGLRKGLQLIAK